MIFLWMSFPVKRSQKCPRNLPIRVNEIENTFRSLANRLSLQEYDHIISQVKNRKDLCRLSRNPDSYVFYRFFKAGITKLRHFEVVLRQNFCPDMLGI